MFEAIISSFQAVKKNKLKQELLLDELLDKKERLFKRFPKYADPNILLIKNSLVGINVEFKERQAKLADAFYTLATNIVRYAKFNLVEEDDAIQEGVMTCFEKIDRFNPSKGRAFNYFTTVSINQLRAQFRTAKNFNELKRKYHEFSTLRLMTNGWRNY